MEYMVENILEKDKNFYVNYVNFRGYAIASYKNFLDIYFQPIQQENKTWLAKIADLLPLRLGLFKGTASLPVKGINFGINIELYNQLQNNEIDPFVLLMDILSNIKTKRQPILILDEIQTLKDIYMNGELKKKHLLTEFFNFLSRLQKVNFSVRGQANERCDGCNYLKSLAVRLSPLAVICEFRLFAGDSYQQKTNSLLQN